MKALTRATVLILIAAMAAACEEPGTQSIKDEPLRDVAYDAFMYAYPMIEQVKTVNGMMQFMDVEFNQVSMNSRLPWDNVGMPIVAPNLTSMTGGVFLDLSRGPVTMEIPEVKDRYIVYQGIDAFTHNFYYMGTRGNQGDAGLFTFYNEGQQLPDLDSTPVEVESDHAMIVIRIDVKDESDAERVRGIQNAIKIVDAPEGTRSYPEYDREKQFSPDFVEYVNELINEVPAGEELLFDRFARIGVFSDVELTDAESAEVQTGIDSAFKYIDGEGMTLTQLGAGWIGATQLFGTREFLDNNYVYRAVGAHFGLWGNSKEEANYFMTRVEGEGEISFAADELPPLTDIGFWSVTAHDENMLVQKNEFDSYVLTQDKMAFEDDGSLTIKFSSRPEGSNWLYTPGGKMAILIRAYQADPALIGDYVPPAFVPASCCP